MTREEHLLTIAMEECAEIAQRLSKAMRFGLNEVQPDPVANPDGLNNRERIYEEYYHLRAVLGMAGIDAWDVSWTAKRAEQAKTDKVEKFLLYSATCGTLT